MPAPDEPLQHIHLDPLPQRILSAALDLAATGQPVFPCYPGDVTDSDGKVHEAKDPMTLHGFHSASLDPERITRWWTRNPTAAIGMPTGLHFNVLDVDNKPGGVNGYAALHFLNGMRLLRGMVREVRTPSGGTHL